MKPFLYLILLLFLYLSPSNSHATSFIPTFCSSMEEEKTYIESIIKAVKGLETGYTPSTLYDRVDADALQVLNKKDDYNSLLEETLDNIRKIAKLREETIYLVHPPESGNEYQKCCVMTCSYLSKNRNMYQ